MSHIAVRRLGADPGHVIIFLTSGRTGQFRTGRRNRGGRTSSAGDRGDRRPVGGVERDLDLVVLAGGVLPVELQLGDVIDRADVDVDPLGVGELAAPAGRAVAVAGVGSGERAVLQGGGEGRVEQHQVGAGRVRSCCAGLVRRVARARGVNRADDVVVGRQGRDRGVLVRRGSHRRRVERVGRCPPGEAPRSSPRVSVVRRL